MSLGWWLVIALALGITEVLTVNLIFVNLGLAAVVAGLVALLGFGLLAQIIAFCIAALLLLVLVRPWGKAFLAKRTPNIQTNAQGLIGKNAVVLETVDVHDGRVRLDGEVWSARTQGIEIPKGMNVVVLEIDGATAIVAPAMPEQVG
ncbi:MAG: NfeD family protein [Actinomycetaceae bacterium]|nr:NfeD family protein [Actinomycetaceae bacterium]